MRDAAILMLGALAAFAGGAPRVAAAKPSCSRVAEQPDVLWFAEGGYPRYGDHLACTADAAGGYAITLTAVNGGQRVPLGEARTKEVPLRRQPHDFFVLQEINDRVCKDLKPPPGATLFLDGPPGDEEVRFNVTVEARFEGRGDLQPLSRTVTAKYPCRACDRSGGSFYFRILDWKKTAELEISMSPEWWACAKRGASLEARLFYGEDNHAALGSIQPDVVIPFPLDRIEGAVTKNGSNWVGKLAVPYAKLCKGKPNFIAWELWGDGILWQAGGGGRSVDQGICK